MNYQLRHTIVMTTSRRDFDFSHLSAAERILLAQELLDGALTDGADDVAPLTEEEIAELRRRISLLDTGQMQRHSWDSVQAEFSSSS